MLYRRAARFGLCWMMLAWWAAGAAAAETGSVTPVSQERVIEATLPDNPAAVRIETGPGGFDDTRRVYDSLGTFCLPRGGGCVTFDFESVASQRSLITAPVEGVLEIRGTGSVLGRSYAGPAGHAVSRLTSTFRVDGIVPYVLQADGRSGASMVLANELGAIVEHRNWSGHVSDAGQLPAGTYTLTVEVSGTSGAFDVRFTAGGTAPNTPRCTTQVDKQSYVFGDVVRAATLSVENPTGDAVAVELKIWLRLPDGRDLPARNDGADGTLIVPAGLSRFFAGVDVFGVGPEIAPGFYEFGCRLLNPVTGERFDEHSDLFEVR